eukprot:TRINITY_DN42084_c0_g1_i1.p1 TRINITY_DN42084_c0_g1~~TRINITY_DN42084_c0_g1_i1.p1  ORF type:complete len:345 (+),score=126.77 TRINITY_DN42084_c0_g1_i1:44-1036(+)
MAPTEEDTKKDEAPEDPPIVVELKKVDDEYLKLQKEFEAEKEELLRKFKAQQKPLLEQRSTVLRRTRTEGAEDSSTGTPALKGFWCQALKNHPAFEDEIEGYDEPVLEYLRDIEALDLDEKDSKKGFRLRFHFAENPYFTNSVLSKEYLVGDTNPWNEEMDLTEIRGCTIDWKEGKDVTVEKVKKEKGGSKKKKGSAKASVEPRPSFFREMFRTLKEGQPLPEDCDPHEIAMAMDADEDCDEEDMVDFLMENDYEIGQALREQIIPFAVRWYTGEAAPEDDDYDEDEESEDEDDDDDEEDEDDDEDDAPKGKAGKKKAAGKQKQEECKQQ